MGCGWQLKNPDKVCIYCHKHFTKDDTLNHIWSKYSDDQNKQYSMDTLIIYAKKLKKEDLVSVLKDNKEPKA